MSTDSKPTSPSMGQSNIGGPPPNRAPAASMQDYYDRIAGQSLAPLWESLHIVVPPSPTTAVQPVKWDYDNGIRPVLMEAGRLITAAEAERRVLMLENPGLPGQSAATGSLYAGIQLVLPGEVAPLHRHSQSALRFILEGAGAYTAVNGEQIFMHPGDLVLTPSWNWHDHGNETEEPIVWLDGLDIPLVRFFSAGFAQPGNAERQSLGRPPEDNRLRFGQGLVPVDWKPDHPSSPMSSYPYSRTREILDGMRRAGPPDPCHGYKMRYINPTTGGPVMPTIGAAIQLVDARMTTAQYRSTDASVYVVAEGTGSTRIGDVTFHWKPRDIFVVPSWAWVSHRADSEAVLFSFSDRPVQNALALFREERRDEG
jgi:gentisate 1,2-dioxygenase